MTFPPRTLAPFITALTAHQILNRFLIPAISVFLCSTSIADELVLSETCGTYARVLTYEPELQPYFSDLGFSISKVLVRDVVSAEEYNSILSELYAKIHKGNPLIVDCLNFFPLKSDTNSNKALFIHY